MVNKTLTIGRDDVELMIYGVGAVLFDMLEKKRELRGDIERVFETDPAKIGFKSQVLGVRIEAAKNIRFLPTTSRIVVGVNDFAAAEREIHRFNPYVKCLTLLEAVNTQGVTDEVHEENLNLVGKGFKAILSEEEEKIYLGIYDLARMNLRNLGLDMAVGRKSYLMEIEAQAKGNYEALDRWEYESLSDRDYVEVVYKRILKRTPNAEELSKGLDLLKKHNGRASLLQMAVDMGTRQGEV